MQLLLCYNSNSFSLKNQLIFHKIYLDEGVYCDTYGKRTKDILLQWGELPTSVGQLNLKRKRILSKNFLHLAYISNGKVMGWGNKAIEIRNVDSATLDGVFMHKRAQKLK